MTTRSQWQRVHRNRPCPICQRPGWCLLAANGSAAICARVGSGKRCGEAGWLHRLADAPWDSKRSYFRHVPLTVGARGADLARLAAEFGRAVDPGRLQQLATSLGLTADSLVSLRIGWSGGLRAWTFPMVGTDGRVLGIRLRRPDGFKFAVKGGREGLFVPSGVEVESSPLLICEGPTDVAGLLDMGFRNVVGRPSCTGGVKLLAELVKVRRRPEVVVVADNDEPGRRGADSLASVLLAYAPAVRVVGPPQDIKDVRDWWRSGGTRRDVEAEIEAVPVRRLAVRGRILGLKG